MAKKLAVKTTGKVEFILTKDRMSSMHLPLDNRIDNHRHWAYRKDVRQLFKDDSHHLPTGGDYLRNEDLYEYWGGINKGFEVIKNGTSIMIGCMRFAGENFRRLRKWALHGSK